VRTWCCYALSWRQPVAEPPPKLLLLLRRVLCLAPLNLCLTLQPAARRLQRRARLAAARRMEGRTEGRHAPGSPGAHARAAALWRTAARDALRMRRISSAKHTWVPPDTPTETCVRHDYDAGASGRERWG
jgi:hypothetical protein